MSLTSAILIRTATSADIASIQRIYNEGIQDRIATLDLDPKGDADIARWFAQHDARYCIIVANHGDTFVGWASLNRYSTRKAYHGVADISLYISREYRGKGIGRLLLENLQSRASESRFHKLILFTFPFNVLAQSLYRRAGFREVGVFQKHGTIDGHFVDVMAMEKQLPLV